MEGEEGLLSDHRVRAGVRVDGRRLGPPRAVAPSAPQVLRWQMELPRASELWLNITQPRSGKTPGVRL